MANRNQDDKDKDKGKDPQPPVNPNPEPQAKDENPSPLTAENLKDRRGPLKWYHVGLVEEAPLEVIDVPTVAVIVGKGPAAIRGKCVSVPKRTGRLTNDGKGNFVHIEGARVGRFEKLYQVEYEHFIKYVQSHVFRRTSTYEVPIEGKPGETETKWRADIELMDTQFGSVRGLHDDDDIKQETIDKYVWIVECKNNKNELGTQSTVYETITQAKKSRGASPANAS